jgi:hypothetical protein
MKVLNKIRLALAATLLALAAVSAVDSASAGWALLVNPAGGPYFGPLDPVARYP